MKRSIMHEALISLIEARCTLDHPDKWTKGEHARDTEEKSVNPNNTLACKFDLQGAVMHSVYSRALVNRRTLCPTFIGEFKASDVITKALDLCIPFFPETTGIFYGNSARLVHFNDRVAAHKDVLLVLDKAITSAKEAFEKELSLIQGD